MGKKSRTKGQVNERAIVNLLKDKGIPAKRISMLETSQFHDRGDVLVADIWVSEVKCGSHVPVSPYAWLEDKDMLFTRRDRQRWLITMDLEFFLDTFI